MPNDREAMTLEQVRDVLRKGADWVCHGATGGDVRFSDLADAIDAYLSRAAEPVGWQYFHADLWHLSESDEPWRSKGMPVREVFIHPSGYARDAKRYRWLAEHEDADLYMENPGKDALDAAVDAAMAKENGNAKGSE